MAIPARVTQSNTLSSDEWRLFIESVQDYAIFMLDLHGNVVTWNRGAEKIKGYAADEIVGRHFSVFYPDDDRALGAPARDLARARALGRCENNGWRIRRDGSRFWANLLITALEDEHGELRGFAKVTRDCTASRAAEEQLKQSEERLRLLIEAVSDYAIYMLDPHGRITTWNSGAENIKGYSAAEVLGKNFSLFFPPQDVENKKPELELELSRVQGHFEEEGLRVRKDGSQFWANVVLTPIRDAKGELLGFAKVTRDLTARVEAERITRELVREQAARAVAEEAEAQVRESERRFRELSERLQIILEGVADGISVQDRSGRVIFANTAAANLSGFSSVEEFLTAAPDILARFELFDEAGAPLDPDSLPGRRVLRGERAATLSLRVRDRASGRQWWSLVRATSVQGSDHEPQLAINIWHDVTEDRLRERRDKYLTQAAVVLSESLDYASMLPAFAQLLVPELSDVCVIHLAEGNKIELAALAHASLEQSERALEIIETPSPDPVGARGVFKVLRTGVSELHEDLSDALLAQIVRDSGNLEVLRTLAMKSAIIVPIRARERVVGTISLISTKSAQRYDQHDLSFAEELGRVAGSSLENARLYAAEKKARDQVALLARAGESFSAASSEEEMFQKLVAITLPTLGDFAFIELVEHGKVRRITAAHDDPKVLTLLETKCLFPADHADKNLCALSSGQSGFHPVIDSAWRQAVASSPEQLELFRRTQLRSMITVPLSARLEVVGALTICFGKSGRHHTLEDLELAEELSRRAALAITQVRLYAEAQEAAKRAEDAAKRAEEANRVKDEFLATVSHELRTPLNAILGWSSLLRARNPDPSLTKGIEVIYRNALAQSKIIEDILDVSRIITGKLRLDLKGADLVAIVRDAIEVVSPSALAKHLSIEFAPPEESCSLVADPERLQQVIWNLLSNAVKFTDSGGRVTIVIRHEGSRLSLSVTDMGRGIDPDFLPFVFDRFKQADGSPTRRVGGLGLGLAIVRHLVELHGGEVEARSEGIGHGATFTVRLPIRAVTPAFDLSPVEGESPGDRRSNTYAGALSGKRVLVVDDEADARELLQVVLTSAGAIVETASSAAEGFAALQRFRADVLVSDIGMPDEDGYSFMQRVRALGPSTGGGIPSLALTAFARGQDRTKTLAMGFTTHLGKPVDPDDLVTAVKNLASLRGQGES